MKKNSSSTVRLVMTMAIVGGAALATNACTLKQDDASRFGEAIPKAQEAALSVPGSQAKGSTASSVSRAGLHVEGNPPPGTFAEWYVFTRNVSDGVDFGTLVILGAVELITHTTPTSVTAHKAVWGPGNGNALDPMVWRMTVDETGSEEYDYRLEARPKASTSEADFKAVLTGHGYGALRPEHKSGWFQIDQDAYNALDPLRAHDSGTVKVTFDGRKYPATIRAVVNHTQTGESFDVLVTHNQDTSGQVDINAHGDVDPLKNTKMEDVTLHSRWLSTGAGRADVEIIGGDAPGTVIASECWSTAFARSYYTDNVNYKPTQGDAASCVLPQAAFLN